VRDHYRRAALVLLPGEEDFGIVPVEAQACGRPVVALGRGGALETVVDGVTGILVAQPTAADLAAGIARAIGTTFDAGVIRQHALRFDSTVFERSVRAEIESLVHA
jgi:glycosyltransferase involved in cell wall biosynthesis